MSIQQFSTTLTDVISIWSTPKNAGNEARKIKRVVDNCTTRKAEADKADATKEREP